MQGLTVPLLAPQLRVGAELVEEVGECRHWSEAIRTCIVASRADDGAVYSGSMELAAIIVSVVAVLVALIGAYLTHGEAQRANMTAEKALKVAEQGHELDAERRWEELTPLFEAIYSDGDRVALLCREYLDYSQVTFDIVGENPPISGLSVPDFDGPVASGSLGSFKHGEERSFLATRTDTGYGVLRLRLQAYGVYRGDETSWEVIVDCEVPPRPSASWA